MYHLHLRTERKDRGLWMSLTHRYILRSKHHDSLLGKWNVMTNYSGYANSVEKKRTRKTGKGVVEEIQTHRTRKDENRKKVFFFLLLFANAKGIQADCLHFIHKETYVYFGNKETLFSFSISSIDRIRNFLQE